ncbi:hypothetical protein [Streptomyces tropicalis]|uniref:Lipoprotein n=1 Tax=Streptomyces tropicalis TaxID=3034234 RepID=A0ABT6ACG9_9ACTN|nr:hypothetical protein [Streptomyces tropicalis]MDF3302137.1 hypothetical protein [Streptomyces tropicalis]
MRASVRARRRAGLTAAAAVLGPAAVSCDSGSAPDPGPPASPSGSGLGSATAYDAGRRAGRRLFEAGGKGAAVREVVRGGCVRRSLTARPRAVVERDRGAWVLGLQAGRGRRRERRPPVRPVTRREPGRDLAARFRSWACANGAEGSARQAGGVVLVHLGDRDYDVELTTTLTGRTPAAEVRRPADAFAAWWDGDDGDGSIAWDLILLTTAGRRLAIREL